MLHTTTDGKKTSESGTDPSRVVWTVALRNSVVFQVASLTELYHSLYFSQSRVREPPPLEQHHCQRQCVFFISVVPEATDEAWLRSHERAPRSKENKTSWVSRPVVLLLRKKPPETTLNITIIVQKAERNAFNRERCERNTIYFWWKNCEAWWVFSDRGVPCRFGHSKNFC